MYRRRLEGKGKALGRSYQSTPDTINNLGFLYVGQGQLKEAEAMYQYTLLDITLLSASLAGSLNLLCRT